MFCSVLVAFGPRQNLCEIITQKRKKKHLMRKGTVESCGLISNEHSQPVSMSRDLACLPEVPLSPFEPSNEIMVHFVLCKLILQMCMRRHPVGLDI